MFAVMNYRVALILGAELDFISSLILIANTVVLFSLFHLNKW